MAHFTELKAEEFFPLLDRTSERQRALLSGIEALAFGHPYKKFYYRVETADLDMLKKSQTYGVTIEVMDYGVRVGRISTYKPDGMERDKLQVQFEYNYNVHQKEPRNIKRSSNHNKVLEFAKLFRPAPINTSVIAKVMFNGAPEKISDVTKLRSGVRKAKEMISKLYYGSGDEPIQLVYDLIHNNLSTQTDKFKTEFESAYAEAKEAQAQYELMTNRLAVVLGTPFGEYLLTRYEYEGKGDRNEYGSYKWSMVVVKNRITMPDDVAGKISVLDMANHSDTDSKVVVDGVGVLDKTEGRMLLLGEDLNGIDTRTESQDPSSQSS